MKAYNTGQSGNDIIYKYRQNLKIGKGSTFNDRCIINARYGIEIGENTLIGYSVVILSVNHVIKNIEIEQNATDKNSWCHKKNSKRITGKKIIIGNDVWIGSNCIILPGAVIPDKCVIGAGVIVTEKNSKILKKGDIVVNDVKLRILNNRENINKKFFNPELVKFWSNIDEEQKHFIDKLSIKKKNLIINRVERWLFDYVDFSTIKTALDWGCGGGLLTKELLKHGCETYILDILPESTAQVKEHFSVKRSYVLKDLQDYDFIESIDLILCHAVIYHFPSLDYWNEVLKIWFKMKPEYILIQIKTAKQDEEQSKPYNDANYAISLLLNKEKVKDIFKENGYFCVNCTIEKAKNDLCYLVFKHEG